MAGMPSLVKQSLTVAEDLGRGFYSYMAAGALHNIGAEATEVSSLGTKLKLFGRNIQIHPTKFTPSIGGMEAMTGGQKLGAGVQVLMAGVSAGAGFMEGGVLGALRNVIYDVGVDAAMVKYGYKARAAGAGVSALHHKGLLNMGGRYIMGGMASYGVGAALGGGPIGAAGALVGGSLGVKHAGKLALAYAGYYGAKTVARGTYELFRAGHSHFQAQKQIQTAGSMAAFNTQAGFTMRERAVQAISRSHTNARSALGHEASYMSNPSRSYFSQYRMF